MSNHSLETGLSAEVRDRLYAVRQQLSRYSFFESACLVLLASLIAIFAVGAIDFVFPLPYWLRIIFALGLLSGTFATLVRWMKGNEQIDDLAAARAIEQANPLLGQRLRTAHQFDPNQQPADRPQLSGELIAQTNQIASKAILAESVHWKKLRAKQLGIGALVVLLVATLAFWSETRTTLARLLLVPVHYSNLAVTHPEPVVAGSNATVNVIATGRPLKRVELWSRAAGETEWTKTPMLPRGVDPENLPAEFKGELVATLESCTEDTRYRVVASPLPTQSDTLKVLQPLDQTGFAATIDPPGYTGAEPETVDEMDMTVVEGSVVSWELELSRQPSSAELVANNQDDKPLPRLEIEGNKLVCDLSQLDSTVRYEVRAETDDGMKFTSDPLRIRVLKDKGPKVVFQKPEGEMEATPTMEVGLRLRATDDFGLGKIGIEYQINDNEPQILWEQDLAGESREHATAPVLFLEQHQLDHDDAITYFAFAEDNRDEPKRTRSELQFIDIRPYKREYQIVDGNCQGSGSCLTLEELIKRQRHTLRRTFANLDRQPIQDSLSKRLSISQQEIRDATREFTSGWELQFGPMPMLHDALASMDRATEELARKSLDTAMPLEESALANLVRARQNARQYLKNCSGGGLAQCKKFDTQMTQKLRQPEKQDDAASKSMAETRDKIQKMAEQQRRFSEDVAGGSGGAQLEKRPDAQQQASQSAGSKPAAGKSGQSQNKPGSAQGQSLAQQQQSAASQAEKLRQMMSRNQDASELAQQRMNEAAEQIQQSAEQLQAGDQQVAAESARRAAELLEQLDEHLQGLSEADLAQRLAIAEQIASRLATAESDVSRSLQDTDDTANDSEQPFDELAQTQRRLSQQAETLADVLRYLEGDALHDEPELMDALADIQQVHDPEGIASDMMNVASQIQNQQSQRAGSGAADASNRLNQIASQLGAARRGTMQPQLEDLIAAEQQTAELLAGIKESRSPSELTQMYEQLQTRLADLRITPSTLPGAAGASNGGSSSGSTGGPTLGPEFHYSGRAVNGELRQIMNVLQSRIQAAILLTAKMDADEPVPAKYRELVNEYYQALSDDLR